jgi:hypothetical protein
MSGTLMVDHDISPIQMISIFAVLICFNARRYIFCSSFPPPKKWLIITNIQTFHGEVSPFGPSLGEHFAAVGKQRRSKQFRREGVAICRTGLGLGFPGLSRLGLQELGQILAR